MLFSESTSILQDIQAIIAALFVSIDWDIIFFVGIAFEILFAIFYIIKSRFSYEVRVVKKLLKLNNWLNKNRCIDQNNLIEFNNMMKHTPKHLRYYWHEYMLNREKAPSHYMSTYNLVEKPLKSSSYLANIKNFKTTTIIMAGILLLFSVLKISTVAPTLGDIGLCLITPLIMVLLYGILSIVMRASQNMNINSLYQYVHYFGRFLDRAVTTMPDYVDFEVLFTRREIKKGIPVLNEYLEKRARQEQEELEKARVNAVEHEAYDFSSTGINGSLVLERAINESETYINIRSRLLSEIQQLEDEIESIKRTYENTEKDYQKKMQVSKENVDRLRKQQEETTNRIENNYIKKQQADEIKKQEQLEKDHDAATIRFNQEMEGLNAEIVTRRGELEQRRKYVEEAMKAEYQTFATKLYKSLETILKEENQDERDELVEIKDEIAESLQQANDVIAQKDREIAELYKIMHANGIDVNEYSGFSSEALKRESRKKKGKKSKHLEDVQIAQQSAPQADPVIQEPAPNMAAAALAPTANFANDPNLIPLNEIPEHEKQYGEDGGFYDKNGYYRYANGTYFTPNSEFHDEFGGWYEADGITYHEPEENVVENAQAAMAEVPVQEDVVIEAPAEEVQNPTGLELMNAVPENEREYSDDGGFFDKEGNYFYPNGTYFTADGRFFDEFGGWYEADGVTYHAPNDDDDDDQETLEPVVFKEDSKDSIVLRDLKDEDPNADEEEKQKLSDEALKEIQKLRDQFNIEVEKDKTITPEQAAEMLAKPEEDAGEETKEEDAETPAEETQPQEILEDVSQEVVEQPTEESAESAQVEQPKRKKEVEIFGGADAETLTANDLFAGTPAPVVEQATAEPMVEIAPKKGRGRPRKEPVETVEEPTHPKKSRGRPKKVVEEAPAQTEDLFVPAPAAESLFEASAEPVVEEPKKSRGRPHKAPADAPAETPAEPKKGRGRPRKEPAEQVEQPQVKKGRGRPKKSVASQVAAEKPNDFADLMATPADDELDKLNEKIENENKRLAESQEELDKSLTEALFQLAGDDDK